MKPLQVSIKEAIRLIGLSRSTLYRMDDSGEIKFNRVRGRTMIPMDELERVSTLSVGEPVGEPKKRRMKKRKLIPIVNP